MGLCRELFYFGLKEQRQDGSKIYTKTSQTSRVFITEGQAGYSSSVTRMTCQVLSHSVAAGVSTMVTGDILPPEADETALFVGRMDQLVNAFNSSSKCSRQKMRRAISEVSGHKEFLQDTLAWLSTLRTNSTRLLPFMHSWRFSGHTGMAINPPDQQHQVAALHARLENFTSKACCFFQKICSRHIVQDISSLAN